MAKAERLTADEAKAKASECRDLAKRVQKPEHRTMLEYMAEAWDQIATPNGRSKPSVGSR